MFMANSLKFNFSIFCFRCCSTFWQLLQWPWLPMPYQSIMVIMHRQCFMQHQLYMPHPLSMPMPQSTIMSQSYVFHFSPIENSNKLKNHNSRSDRHIQSMHSTTASKTHTPVILNRKPKNVTVMW